jgi:hypothetical protein
MKDWRYNIDMKQYCLQGERVYRNISIAQSNRLCRRIQDRKRVLRDFQRSITGNMRESAASHNNAKVRINKG